MFTISTLTNILSKEVAQLTFTCSKSTTEVLKGHVTLWARANQDKLQYCQVSWPLAL